MSEGGSPAPLKILDCSLLILSTGRSAQNLRELRDHINSVPVRSLTHHFYDSLLRPTFDHPDFRNDFARWAARQLRDELLAERLGVMDPFDYAEIEEFRRALIDVIEDRLAESHEVPQAPRGQEFHFLSSRFLVNETGKQVRVPAELAAMVPAMSPGSIFYHFIEARRSNPGLRDDFSTWLSSWGESVGPLRERLAAIDYSLWSLTELRDRIEACLAEAPAGTQAG